MTNAKNILSLAIASIDTSNPENFKWATAGAGINGRPALADMVAAVAYQTIADALIDTHLTSREQRAIRDEIKQLVIENAHAFNPSSYLMKNEIAAIKKIVLANI